MSATPRAGRQVALAVAAVLGACATARAPAPAAPERRAFAVPGDGALEIAIPPGWVALAERREPPAPPTIRLEPPGGGFVALLTPFWSPQAPDDAGARAETAQLLAELARREALAGALEREVALEELVGEGVHGFWFAVTDRALVDAEPGPDEYRHLLQGAAAVGRLLVAFALLDQGPGPHRAALLEVVRGARHVASERDPAAADDERRERVLPGAPSGEEP